MRGEPTRQAGYCRPAPGGRTLNRQVMQKYLCSVCGYVYDPAKGIPEMGIAPGTPFEDLPDDFECPVCGVGKESFAAVDETSKLSEPVRGEVAARVEAVIPETPSVKSIRFAVSEPAPFLPGQYMSLTLNADKALNRCLTISNSPTEKGYLQVTKRITESRFSQILNQAKPGDHVQISYPFGSFVLEEEFPKIGMLCGGIGITPFRSMCRYLVDQRLELETILLYSNRSREEIAFERDFLEMQRKTPNFRAVFSLSRADDSWNGKRGRIDADMVTAEIPDYRERCFYLCGPPQMVAALSSLLLDQLKMPRAQV
jgi:glycine betaine catabolism B